LKNPVERDLGAGSSEFSSSIALPNGDLRIVWRERDWRLDELCGFAARANQRRGFLIVSRVLGRHLPARPSVIRATSEALASCIPSDLPGPVLFVGMAETAITLGQTVHAIWCRRADRLDALYLHSTRQLIGREPLIRFSEPHSHASSHLIYAPDPAAWSHELKDVRSLVLVDDEVTTGRTFTNLTSQLVRHLPQLEQIQIAVLTDWSSGGFLDAMPVKAVSHSLLDGMLTWHGQCVQGDAITAAPTDQLGTMEQRRNLGRLGSTGLNLDFDDFCANLAMVPKQKLHVVGTGELHYPAFLLGERLEQAGHDVLVQATTRSPARIGGDINMVVPIADNYRTGVANYLYNTAQTASRARIVCHETLSTSLDPALLRPGDVGAVDFGALS